MHRRRLLPIRTDRLEIRALAEQDITVFTTYRNDPTIARYQDWTLPWTRDLTHELIHEQDDNRGPVPGRWVQLAIDDGSGIVGDLRRSAGAAVRPPRRAPRAG